MEKIRIGIVGYGNLGRGIETALTNSSDLELFAIFTRRDPATIATENRVESFQDIFDYKNDLDVLILAGGSQKDIPVQGPELAAHFNTVDCFDNHASIADYYIKMNEIALATKHVSTIAIGWDPGLFSLQRMMAEAILPEGNSYTFWGKGLSQGHSDAVCRVPGVKMGAQYTIPDQAMIEQIKSGQDVDYTSVKAHQRLVYVVAESDADQAEIKEKIVKMPDYFAPYQTEVKFITGTEFKAKHQGMPHGGTVIRQGSTSPDNKAVYEFNLKLESNPEYTAAISVAFARATYKLFRAEQYGAKTIFDIPLGLLSNRDSEDLLHNII